MQYKFWSRADSVPVGLSRQPMLVSFPPKAPVEAREPLKIPSPAKRRKSFGMREVYLHNMPTPRQDRNQKPTNNPTTPIRAAPRPAIDSSMAHNRERSAKTLQNPHPQSHIVTPNKRRDNRKTTNIRNRGGPQSGSRVQRPTGIRKVITPRRPKHPINAPARQSGNPTQVRPLTAPKFLKEPPTKPKSMRQSLNMASIPLTESKSERQTFNVAATLNSHNSPWRTPSRGGRLPSFPNDVPIPHNRRWQREIGILHRLSGQRSKQRQSHEFQQVEGYQEDHRSLEESSPRLRRFASIASSSDNDQSMIDFSDLLPDCIADDDSGSSSDMPSTPGGPPQLQSFRRVSVNRHFRSRSPSVEVMSDDQHKGDWPRGELLRQQSKEFGRRDTYFGTIIQDKDVLVESIEKDDSFWDVPDSVHEEDSEKSDNESVSNNIPRKHYDVLKIVGEKIGPNVHEFLVKWMDYDEVNWISDDDCFCPDLIEEFREAQRMALEIAIGIGHEDEKDRLMRLHELNQRLVDNVVYPTRKTGWRISRRDRSGRFAPKGTINSTLAFRRPDTVPPRCLCAQTAILPPNRPGTTVARAAQEAGDDDDAVIWIRTEPIRTAACGVHTRFRSQSVKTEDVKQEVVDPMLWTDDDYYAPGSTDWLENEEKKRKRAEEQTALKMREMEEREIVRRQTEDAEARELQQQIEAREEAETARRQAADEAEKKRKEEEKLEAARRLKAERDAESRRLETQIRIIKEEARLAEEQLRREDAIRRQRSSTAVREEFNEKALRQRREKSRQTKLRRSLEKAAQSKKHDKVLQPSASVNKKARGERSTSSLRRSEKVHAIDALRRAEAQMVNSYKAPVEVRNELRRTMSTKQAAELISATRPGQLSTSGRDFKVLHNTMKTLWV